ncbi:class I SAM-dependent methyltransferase [Cryobacterium sp. Hz9]|nr:class I SAM-dependent methyltransferase [Cryobacterium sp. Hz9]
MRQHIIDGTDLEVDARFVDMLAPRGSTILDIGCGHGSAVNGLRARGHAAFGIDPTPEVLNVAFDNFDSDWYRELGVEELSPVRLAGLGILDTYDMVLIAGNVAAFLSGDALRRAFVQVSALLKPGGTFVVGTSSQSRGGPQDQDDAGGATGLELMRRFSDWHLGHYSRDSAWSVSVYAAPGESPRPESPDGMFILK